MSGSYLNNKKSIYNWREKNPERCEELKRKSNERRKDWCKVCVVFRRILIDDLAVPLAV